MHSRTLGTGTITVQADAACEVRVDDVPIGHLKGGEEKTFRVPAGRTVVRAEGEHGEVWEREVDVAPHDELTIPTALTTPLPSGDTAPAQKSNLIIRTPRKSSWRWGWLAVALLGLGALTLWLTDQQDAVQQIWQSAFIAPEPLPPVADTLAVSATAPTNLLLEERLPEGVFLTDWSAPAFGELSDVEDAVEQLQYTPPAEPESPVDSFAVAIGNDEGATGEGVFFLRLTEGGALADVPDESEPAPERPTPADLNISYASVPAGTYTMGSSGGSADNRPPHEVEITQGFSISAHPVTVEQFRLFVEATDYTTEAERVGHVWVEKPGDNPVTQRGLTWREPGYTATDTHPVTNVSWNDAQAFARWAGVRLPTEAEWEYAARAGVEANRLPGDWEETTWYAENAEAPQPVMWKEPNEWGLYDVQGNVWEWVQDWYAEDYYANSSGVDPQGPSSGNLRVTRGGSWMSQAAWLPMRNRASPSYRTPTIGFRVVQE